MFKIVISELSKSISYFMRVLPELWKQNFVLLVLIYVFLYCFLVFVLSLCCFYVGFNCFSSVQKSHIRQRTKIQLNLSSSFCGYIKQLYFFVSNLKSNKFQSSYLQGIYGKCSLFVKRLREFRNEVFSLRTDSCILLRQSTILN